MLPLHHRTIYIVDGVGFEPTNSYLQQIQNLHACQFAYPSLCSPARIRTSILWTKATRPALRRKENMLSRHGSNVYLGVQSSKCCHYTTGQYKIKKPGTFKFQACTSLINFLRHSNSRTLVQSLLLLLLYKICFHFSSFKY